MEIGVGALDGKRRRKRKRRRKDQSHADIQTYIGTERRNKLINNTQEKSRRRRNAGWTRKM